PPLPVSPTSHYVLPHRFGLLVVGGAFRRLLGPQRVGIGVRPAPEHFAIAGLKADQFGGIGRGEDVIVHDNDRRNGSAYRSGFPQYILLRRPGPGWLGRRVSARSIVPPADRWLVG